jgi:hypothetical protein
MTCEERTMPSMKCRLPRRHAPSLEQFVLEELALFRKAGTFASNASRDFQLFYVGGEDVHAILEYLLSRATTSLYLNMFGYDDEELSGLTPQVHVGYCQHGKAGAGFP